MSDEFGVRSKKTKNKKHEARKKGSSVSQNLAGSFKEQVGWDLCSFSGVGESVSLPG